MDNPTPHLALVASNGAVITLPVSAWLDQTLARSVLTHAGADQPPPLDDDLWIDLVFYMLEHATTDTSEATR